MTAGLGIYDTMQYIRPPVATWCVGQACSMGAFLLAAGERGTRYCLPHSRVMIHQPHGATGVRVIYILYDISQCFRGVQLYAHTHCVGWALSNFYSVTSLLSCSYDL